MKVVVHSLVKLASEAGFFFPRRWPRARLSCFLKKVTYEDEVDAAWASCASSLLSGDSVFEIIMGSSMFCGSWGYLEGLRCY